MKFILKPGQLTLEDIRLLLDETTQLELDPQCYPAIEASEKLVNKIVQENKTVYGINTGFGLLANTKIQTQDLEQLQESIVLSHAAGTGECFADSTVRLILALKINSLARGYSGVRLELIQTLIQLYNAGICPCIPSQGSVGASGDLAPLAHLSLTLLGVGQARYQGHPLDAKEALAKIGLAPIKLAPKEGLALLNGTQVSTALALQALLAAETAFAGAITTGALSIEASRSSTTPFDDRIHAIRGHLTQSRVAKMLCALLGNTTEIRESHVGCAKVQDAYSLRCQPQVMGACLAQLEYAKGILVTEANGVSDNPLVFAEEEDVLSGGNFHAEPVALAADALAVAIAEIGSLSERRIALLIDPHFSGLPAFLVNNPGVNSGFMIAQVTAAALASENKMLAHPASVDTIPTSANQEDHVSMATHGAKRLHAMAENTIGIVAIELLAACQGIDFLRPLKTSAALETVHQKVRTVIPFYDKDRYFAPDIAKAKSLIHSRSIQQQPTL